MENRNRAQFTPEASQVLLAEACKIAGLGSANAELIRLGENAIYRLSVAPLVVRIARSGQMLDDVRKEMRVARWLALEEYPAVRLVSDLHEADIPLMVSSHPVTFWHFVSSAQPLPGPSDLGGLLRRLHELPVPDWLALPAFQPFARVEQRLNCAPPEVTPGDVDFLRERFRQLKEALRRLQFHFPFGPVHGDAHPANLLRSANGEVVLLDFEAFSWGPREWDLSLTAGYRYGFEWLDERDYAKFVSAYGYDVSQWEGFRVLSAIRELGMTTWLMQLAGHDAARRDEFRVRIDDLRSGRYPRRWRPF
ncbi:phosphotransferase family protein [Micromonospora sp. CPCC 206061]|uniref:phosphotransferase family protein n=1 Tax=Micromonospora sp. CPCC 206061 TaxID=3122410 RepID=UPI002FEFDA2C